MLNNYVLSSYHVWFQVWTEVKLHILRLVLFCLWRSGTINNTMSWDVFRKIQCLWDDERTMTGASWTHEKLSFKKRTVFYSTVWISQNWIEKNKKQIKCNHRLIINMTLLLFLKILPPYRCCFTVKILLVPNISTISVPVFSEWRHEDKSKGHWG